MCYKTKRINFKFLYIYIYTYKSVFLLVLFTTTSTTCMACLFMGVRICIKGFIEIYSDYNL